MANIAVILVLVLILGGAIGYIYKEKKSGTKCIGCPAGKTCAKACGGGCGGCQGHHGQ